MASRDKSAPWKFEDLIFLLYVLISLYLLSSNSITWWWYALTCIFILFFILIKVTRRTSTIPDFLQEICLQMMYNLGLFQYTSMKPYAQYYERRKVIRRILDSKQKVGLAIATPGDSRYLAKHYIHHTFSSLNASDFEDLMNKLFQSMGYAMQKTGKVSEHSCDLIIQLENQKLLLHCIRNKQATTISDITNLVISQKVSNCHGSMLISIPPITKEAEDLAHKISIGLVTKPRLQELLLHYLKENWN